MFTTCPLPRRDYDAESLSYMMAFFPVAGLYVSTVGAATYYLSGLLAISSILRAALVLVAVCVATGGIHLDGFSDASDAFFSRRDANKMLEIMHDVHIGAFAAISLVLLLLLQFAALQSIIATSDLRIIIAVFILPILSRSLSGLYSLNLPSARSNGMHHDYRQNSSGTVRGILIVFLLISAAGLIVSAHYSGLISLILCLLTSCLFARFSLKRFKGATGDLAGFLLVTLETIALLSLALSHNLPAWF
ncbi:MAG: adenosylcobinamide-GDP ribazoletransferase [Eubacteriales bacterium]|nr:adenosylcobinamide-GDP ribazoletransferase [Eubacteriales bacterium]